MAKKGEKYTEVSEAVDFKKTYTVDEAIKLIVSGFIEPLVKELPLEYAVELNRLIELEIENSVC